MQTRRPVTRRPVLTVLAFAALNPGMPGYTADLAALLALDREPPTLAARYTVRVQPASVGAAVLTFHWTFVREAERLTVHKGEISEAWTRSPQGDLAFERSFHPHAKVVDYSPGELTTLGLRADWATLQRFVDREVLQSLRLKSQSGRGAALQLHLQGPVGDEVWHVDWLPALQLPARIERRSAITGSAGSRGSSTTVTMQSHAPTAPAAWLPAPPRPGSPPYVRLDAADFGDMQREPVVRLSEGLDLRGGWRLPHAHP